MRSPSPAVFRSAEPEQFLKSLGPNSKLRKWIEDMEAVLRENRCAGDLIRKSQIPAYYIERHGVNNLYRYQHPEGYRSCYTVSQKTGFGVCPTILDIRSHDEYGKMFGYKKR